MNQRFLLKPAAILSKRNLLLANAVLCLCYAFFYTLLIILPFSEEAHNSTFHSSGVVVVNIFFLAILSLNLNSLLVVYSELAKPRKKYVRIVHIIAMVIWVSYILLTYYLVFSRPGFFTHFHHYVQHSFRSLSLLIGITCSSFAIGFSILCIEYYRQIRMIQMLYFIIPAVLLFAFKTMFPHVLFITSWVIYSGCQLLLYYSMIDCSLLKNKPIVSLSDQGFDFLLPGKSNVAH